MPSAPDDRRAADAQPPLTPAAFTIIRLSLLAGVLLLGGIAWYLTASGQVAPALDDGTAALLRYVFLGLLATAALGIALVRPRARQAETLQQRVRFSIIGYALAEAAALFGAVYLFLTGAATLYLLGLLLFLAAFLLFPADG